MMARLLFILTLLSIAGCGGGTNILPEPFTRERADGKIPVKTELIRQQVQMELGGMPEGEAEVARWQAIETDYHSCRLIADKAKADEEKVFADCMAQRGYVYMYPIDAEQLHNDIAFEMDKNRDEIIAAERKAEKERIATEKKRQEEAERIRRQKELNDALVIALNAKQYAKITEVKRLVDDGADVNTKGKTGWTPLHVAAKSGHTETLNALIKHGADIDAKQEHGATPLHIATGDNHTKTLLALIKYGADINAKHKHGVTPLHIAAGFGKTEILFALIKHGADIDAKENDGWTPLHIAAQENKTEVARALIKAGANLFSRTNAGETPLEVAIRNHGKYSKIARIIWAAMER